MRGASAVVTLVSTLVLAGCQDLHGVEVIVQPGDPAVTSVRLFVGAGGSTSSSLTTSAKVQVDDVEYWSRDVGNEADVVTGVDGTGEVKFLFDTGDTLPVVIAVGYDANHTPIVAGAMTDLSLQAGSSFTGYALPLIGPVAALGQQAATVQLGLWSPDLATSAYDAACAGIVVAGAAHPYFVVTDNDQDCDGLTDDDTAHECTPDAYLGTRDADPSEASCLVSDHSTAGVAQCRLGGSTCTDNVPRNQNMCVAGHTCTLNELCTRCGADFRCAANAQALLPMVDHYECALPRKASDNTICQTTFTLARPPTGGYGCKRLEIGDDMFALGTALTVGGVELDATLQDSATSSCAGKLVAKISSNAMVDFTGLVSFTLKNNASVAVPIHVALGSNTSTSCPATTECALVAGDSAPVTGEAYQPPLTSCAAAWTAPAVIPNLFASNSGTADPTLTADQLEMIYAANDVLYRTTRTAIGGMWGTSTQLDLGGFVVPTGSRLHAPKLSPDGTQLFFAIQDMIGGTAMYYTTRSSSTAPGWGLPAPVINTDGAMEVTSIAFGPSMHVILASTSMTNASALYDATFDPTSKMLTNFMMVEPRGSHPFLTADGMHLYFDALDSTARTTLFVASRRSPTDAFAPEVQLVDLAAGGSVDTAAWVPSNAYTIYFTSQRIGSTVPLLFTATRMSF
ncbi:MAG: hypothetical protein ABJE66_02525 [Deltaproteobacteria bacterium]